MMMKRSQSGNARPRTRLSRSASAASAAHKHGWKLSISIIAAATILLVSVFLLQARLGGFGSHSSAAAVDRLETEDPVLDEIYDRKLGLFQKLQQTKLVDAGNRQRIDISDMEEDDEEDPEEEELNVNVEEKKIEEMGEDEAEADDVGDLSTLKQNFEADEGDDQFDEQVDEQVEQSDEDLEGGEQQKTEKKVLQRLGQIKTVARNSPREEAGNGTVKEKFIWDRVLGIMKMPLDGKTGKSLSGSRKLGLGKSYEKDEMFSGEDETEAVDVEDALFLRKNKQLNSKIFGASFSQKPAPLTNVFDTKYARKVIRPPFDPSNPTGNFLLQDPDTVEPWGLSKSDKAISRAFRKVDEEVPQVVSKKGRKELLSEKASKRVKGDNRKWGAFPGLDPMLLFSEFMQQFLEEDKCELRVFMAWNSAPWSYTVRHQRGLESLLHFHPKACVTVFSETLELGFFKRFWSRGYRVAVVRPNLEEFLGGTPAEMFASVWLEWRKVELFYVHYSELLRLAALYKYGGVYLDADVIVLKPLVTLRNVVGLEVVAEGKTRVNGAVMVFNKGSPYIKACLDEYTATYDDKLLDWNGAELLTRVAAAKYKSAEAEQLRVVRPSWFFPLSSTSVISYFQEGNRNGSELDDAYTLHLWNRQSGSLVPEKNSVVGLALEQHCIWCEDVI